MESSHALRRSRTAVAFSIAMHASVLGLLVWPATHARVRVIPPANSGYVAMLETAGGRHAPAVPVDWLPVTGQTRKPLPDKETRPKIADPARPPRAAKAMAPPLASESTGTGTGTAATGSGNDAQNVSPAFPVFSPKPPVKDHSLLPASEQQIVVDVNLSAEGEVTGETLVKGMGGALDQIVLDTVKTWKFHPATVNGNPVASEAELIFPFNPSYPITRS